MKEKPHFIMQTKDPVSLTLVIIIFVLIFTIMLVFFISRYRKFPPNLYVVWLRNGIVRKITLGGSGVLFPFLDEVTTIPIYEQIFFSEFGDHVIECQFKVNNPDIAYSIFSWDEKSDAYVKNILSTELKEIIKLNHGKSFKEDIVSDYKNLVNSIKEEFINKVEKKGITILEVMIDKYQ